MSSTSFSYATSTLLYFFKILLSFLKVILHNLYLLAFDVFYSKLLSEWHLLNFIYQLLSLFSFCCVFLPAPQLLADQKHAFRSLSSPFCHETLFFNKVRFYEASTIFLTQREDQKIDYPFPAIRGFTIFL